MGLFSPSSQNPLGLSHGKLEKVRVKVRGGDVKVGTIGLTLGIAVLFVSALRERLFTAKTDRYREVKR